jgi:hypothetical protein
MTVRPSHMSIRPNLRSGCSWQQNRGFDFRFGSEADIPGSLPNVRFAPKADIEGAWTARHEAWMLLTARIFRRGA